MCNLQAIYQKEIQDKDNRKEVFKKGGRKNTFSIKNFFMLIYNYFYINLQTLIIFEGIHFIAIYLPNSIDL